MKRLKIILQSKYLFKVLAFILLLGDILFISNYNFKSKYDINDTTFIGVVTKYELQDNKLVLEIKDGEKLIVYYKYNSKIFNNLSYGDKVLVKGTLKEPNTINIPNTFNYQKYLYNKRIYYIVEATRVDKIENNDHILYTIKNLLYRRISELKSRDYIKTLLLGDNTLGDEVNNSYRINGISHLFSISGMHISLITGIIYFYLDRVARSKRLKYIIVDIFLIFYLLLVGTSSLLRSTIMNILFSLNFILKLNIRKADIMLLTLIIGIIINPFIIYDIGFIYSYLISFFLIMSAGKIKNKRKIAKVFFTSILSFIISIPITIYNSYEINVISIFMNIILVPIISIIVFPLTLLTLIFPVLDNILVFITDYIEKISLFTADITITKFIFPKPSMIFIVIYYTILIVVLNKKKYYYLLFIMIIFLYFSPYLNSNFEIMMFDVGEADSILISYPHNQMNILIDTGKNDYIMNSGIIPYLKSRGIRKIDYLIITHGDYDHIGGALTLLDNYKVDHIILNRGDYSDLEIELLGTANKINIISSVEKLKVGRSYIYFLNDQIYDNENDNSNVIYFEYLKYKFLFMGDASFVVEDYLLDNYNLKDISFLKVGHHGSSTSSTSTFIDTINPKIALISVGQNNYGHPTDEVLNNLSSSLIYRTDLRGSINIKIKNNKSVRIACHK